MITISMIFTTFAATVLAKDFLCVLQALTIECSFYDSSQTQHCYGAKGQQLIFHLSAAKNTEIRLTKDEIYRILKIDKNGTVILNNDFVNDFEQIQPGTFGLGNAKKNHSGDYVLEEYRDDGKIVRRVQAHLKIQGPVSKPTISERCFSPEQKTVTCYSNGDDVEFFLTLNGHSLIQSRDHRKSNSNCNGEKSDVSNICISMHGQLRGSLMCQVWNNVSREDSVYQLNACKGSDYAIQVIVPVLAGSAVALCVLLSLLYVKVFKRTPMPPNEVNEEEDVIYADVKVKDTRAK